jgi:hypothetical protein
MDSYKEHWERIYLTKASQEVSWFQAQPTLSLNVCGLHLTTGALLSNNPGVIPVRVAKALCALAAILGLAGLSVLPPEHIHSRSDASAHHAALIHRHFASHHASGTHAESDLPTVRQTLHPGDDDEHARTIQVFFTAGTRIDRHHVPSVAIVFPIGLHDAPPPGLSELSSRAPPPYISPPGTSLSPRGPPAFS